ncbi:Arc family DNA-binding protein [Scandinavium sp. NPDC088450]|uniref:Arc family DNA-binding protein n=1 Tax=Scandinavium sp. NPDC088450 TaxID=3364514 RepID=UPI00384BA3F8
MKSSDKGSEIRGRPRKFEPGTIVEVRLRAPESLLTELRVCARIGERSINDEIIIRLQVSLNYQPDKPLIQTARAERLIALAIKFDEWLAKQTGEPEENKKAAIPVHSEEERLWVWREGQRILIQGKASGYTMRIPDNLAEEVRVMARVHKRSLNDEILTRILNSLDYYSQRLLEHNEDAQGLKVLCLEFEKYIKNQIKEAELTSLDKSTPSN